MEMNKQHSKQVKKQVSMEAMFYRMAEMNPSINIAISIVVLTCCRTVVWKYRFISAKKQRTNVVNH